jgi:F-type H+-transporting ATPase subunit delta
MPNPRLASRYAKSILDLAIEKSQLEEVYADMMWLQSVCRQNRDFVNMLRSPIIKGESKKKIIEAVTRNNISDMTSRFLVLLVSKSRESNLPEMVSSFISAYKALKNIQIVKLTSATPLTETSRSAIVEQVKKSAGYENIEVEEKIDPSIIGGFVLQVGDKLVDASVSYDLRQIAKQFENNDFIYKIR